MSITAINVKANENGHALGPKALKRVLPVLQHLILHTAELQTRVELARSHVPEGEGRIPCLLDGLKSELIVCSSLLGGRLDALPKNLHLLVSPTTTPNSFWRLYPAEELDCREHLEALLAGYSHFARNAYDSIRMLESAGDDKSAEVVTRIIATAEKGLCFIELYLEGMALRMDRNRLPAWPVSSDLGIDPH
jgi:hypothetical protein